MQANRSRHFPEDQAVYRKSRAILTRCVGPDGKVACKSDFDRKHRDAAPSSSGHIDAMNEQSITIDPDTAWNFVLRRDRAADGRFVTGVLTTGIYCRPSCAARHPKRANVRFFADGPDAAAAGLRPCRRCRPDEVTRDAAGVAAAIRLIESSEAVPALTDLAAAAGYAPHHFHRLFKRATGLTPAAYARGRRAGRVATALRENGTVTDAIYDAGYAAPSRFYAEADDRLGMTPSAWRDGGRGETILWAIAETSLGSMLVGATRRGICRLSFGEDAAALAARFPMADIAAGGEALADLVARAVQVVETPGQAHDLPIDVRGTAFQEAVWRELARIPPGETLSYAALAVRAGKPGAARAAGSACGANPIAVLVPCHRAQRGDGTLGGFAYGLPMKQELLRREAAK